MKKLLALLAIVLLFFFACQNTSGTTDDTDTDVAVATLLDETGLPVPNASVRIYTYKDSTGNFVDSVLTDEKGSYELKPELVDGRYSLWAETDSSLFYRDDLILKTDSAYLDTNTLVAAKTVYVPIKMQKNHDPQSVEVQVYGTPLKKNVDVNGFMKLDKITTGTYYTRLTTTIDGYTPTNDSFTVTALSPDTLLDTLELIYTGLPRVIVGSVVNSDGTPAASASVRVYAYRDSTGTWIDSVTTNAQGKFETMQIDAGRYGLWIETPTSMSFREDIMVVENEKTFTTDTLQALRSICVPLQVEPNHNPQTFEAQVYGTPLRLNISTEGFLNLKRISSGTYTTKFTTVLEGYIPFVTQITIADNSPDTLLDTIKIPYTNIPVVTGLAYTYDTLNTTVNLSWDQTDFADIQAYVIERKLKSETVWPAAPLAHVYVSQVSHPVTYQNVVSVGEAGAVYQYRIKILDNSSLSGAPFGVLEVIAPPASSAATTITATSMQKAKGIVGNRASINDIMSFTVNFTNPSRKLTKIDWFEGTTLLKTTPLTDLVISDFFEKSWPVIGTKSLTVQITDDAGFVWKKVIPVSIVEDKPIISFVDTTINLNVLDTLTAVVSDEFGEIVSYQWDWGNDGTIDATTPQFVMTNSEIVGGHACKVTVTDDDGNVGVFVSGVTSQLVWEKVGELPKDIIFSEQDFFSFNEEIARLDTSGFIWSSKDGLTWHKRGGGLKSVGYNKYHMNFITFEKKVWALITSSYSPNGIITTLLNSENLDNWEIIYNSDECNYPAFNVPTIFATESTIYSNIAQEKDFLRPLSTKDGKVWDNCNSDISLYHFGSNVLRIEKFGGSILSLYADGREKVYIKVLDDDLSIVNDLSFSPFNSDISGINVNSCVYDDKLILLCKHNLYYIPKDKNEVKKYGMVPSLKNTDESEFVKIISIGDRLHIYTKSGNVLRLLS